MNKTILRVLLKGALIACLASYARADIGGCEAMPPICSSYTATDGASCKTCDETWFCSQRHAIWYCDITTCSDGTREVHTNMPASVRSVCE
jgi:hypothetical protein